MGHKNVTCQVDGPTNPFGEFANSFRISSDGAEILLDFCVYSEVEGSARVVSRVRVPQEFLPVIHKKIGSSLRIGEDGTTTLFLMPLNTDPAN